MFSYFVPFSGRETTLSVNCSRLCFVLLFAFLSPSRLLFIARYFYSNGISPGERVELFFVFRPVYFFVARFAHHITSVEHLKRSLDVRLLDGRSIGEHISNHAESVCHP